MWLAFLAGISFLLVCQILIIFVCTDWNFIASQAAERMKSEKLIDEIIQDVPKSASLNAIN